MNGNLGLSENFGKIKYKNQILKFTFESTNKTTDWQVKMINISSLLHGQKMKIKCGLTQIFIIFVSVKKVKKLTDINQIQPSSKYSYIRRFERVVFS